MSNGKSSRATAGERLILFGILAAGLLLRLWLWWRIPLHQPANDEVEYLTVARDLVAGRGWVFYERYHWLRAPLYPLFLAGSLLLSGGNLRWAALPGVAVSTAAIPIFYLLGRAVADDDEARTDRRAVRAGLIAAGMSAALLPFATFASLWMSETLFTALFTAALVALLRWARRPRLSTAAAAGVLLGLATLTRSPPLAAVVLLALWMMGQHARGRPRAPYLAGSILCVVMALATIAPWTVRNYLAYGGFIPVETGLSYNLWAFNEPREDADTIFRTLEAIPNPVERSDYATRKGLERLREDPAIVLRKLPTNWSYLWLVKPIEDRFRQGTYYEDIPLGMFVLGLVLDDALYLLILTSGAIGLTLAPNDRRKLLLLGWAVYMIGVMLLTHGEARYRQLLYPTLIPYSSGVLAGLWWKGAMPRRRWAGLALAAFMLLPLRFYPVAWATPQLRRGWVEMAGDRAMTIGEYGAAAAAYRRAAGLDRRSADIHLKLGLAYDRAGQLDRAIEAYRWATAVAPPYPAASARLGDALRRAGRLEEARRAFAGFYTDPLSIANWAWDNLQGPAPEALDVGGGLDIGFVAGMYAAESVDGRQVRWTSGRGLLRLRAGSAGALVRLRLAAPHPGGRPVQGEICGGGRCQPIVVTRDWRTYMYFVPPVCSPGTGCGPASCAAPACPPVVEIALRSPTFVPPAEDPAHARPLGLLVDYAESRPVQSGAGPTAKSPRTPRNQCF